MPQVSVSSLSRILSPPLIMSSDTPLLEAVELMSRRLMSCGLKVDAGKVNARKVNAAKGDAAKGDDRTLGVPLELDVRIPHIQAEESSAGCVLVVDNAKLVGILTEQDIVKLIGERRNLAELSVAEVMSREVVVLSASDCLSPATAIGMMVARKIHHLPVVDSGDRILGLLTQAQLRQLFDTADFMKIRQVREVMDSSVVHALPTDLISQVVQLMAQQRSGYVLISETLEGQHKRLRPIGIITARDIVQFQLLDLDPQRIQAQTIMSHPLFTAKPVDTLWSVSERMRQHRVEQLVVISNQDYFLGVVAQNSLLLEEDLNDTLILGGNTGESDRDADKPDRQNIETSLVNNRRSLNRGSKDSANVDDCQQAELSLRQSEAVMRSFFNSTPLMMGVVEVRGDEIIHISDNAVTACLFNLTPEAMRYRSAKEMGIPPNIIRMWIGYYRQAATTGEPVRFEYLHTAGTEDCWLSATVTTIVGSKRTDVPTQPTGSQNIDGQRFAYVVEDITGRKRIEAKLQEQASLLDVATDAILVRGIDGKIAYWNKGAELLYGWTAQEAIGQVADRLLFLDDSIEEASETNNQKIYKSLKATGRWQGECTQVTKYGQIVTVMSRWTQVSDFRGQPRSVLMVNTDITQSKQLEIQFLRAQRLESIGTLASGIAHDLNNILTPIYGVAHLLPLQLPNANEKMQQQFKILQDSARRGSEIIRQMLSFSRGMDGDRVPVAIQHVIAEVKSFVHKTFPKSIEISVDIPRDLQMVIGDVTQLHQVFMNFFVNARDAMPDGGCISLSATNIQIDEAFVASHIEAYTGPYILVTVADTGTGITPEQLDRIFEPFFTTKQSKGGTGLGLSTAHGIVKSHGGFITVYSEVGKGTQFNVYLPAVENRDVAIVEAAEYPAGNGECILIVDDEAPIREVARSVLENYHYQVLVAEDGIDAIAQYTKNYLQYGDRADADGSNANRIQAILMDMTMPNLCGAKTIEVLQKIDPKLNVIAVSGLPGNQQIAASISDTVKAFVQKPYSSTTLLKTIREVLSTANH